MGRSTFRPHPGADRAAPPIPAPRRPPITAYELVHAHEGAVGPDQRLGDGVLVCRPGWTLIARVDDAWRWSARLDPRGAPPSAPAPVAQDVARRLLAELGVELVAWRDGGPGARPVFTAVVPDRSH